MTDKLLATRLVKCECRKCGYVVRTARKWIALFGVPRCDRVKCPGMQIRFTEKFKRTTPYDPRDDDLAKKFHDYIR